jgi:hypothetical protein
LKLDSMHPSKKKLVENKAVSVGWLWGLGLQMKEKTWELKKNRLAASRTVSTPPRRGGSDPGQSQPKYKSVLHRTLFTIIYSSYNMHSNWLMQVF